MYAFSTSNDIYVYEHFLLKTKFENNNLIYAHENETCIHRIDSKLLKLKEEDEKPYFVSPANEFLVEDCTIKTFKLECVA